MSDWISVKERLPLHGHWVLAFNGKNMAVCWVDINENDYLFMRGMTADSQFKNVTHWHALPESPE